MEIKFSNGSSIETLDKNTVKRSSRAEQQLGRYYSYLPYLSLLNLMGVELKWYQKLFVRAKFVLDKRFRQQIRRDRKIAHVIEQRIKAK